MQTSNTHSYNPPISVNNIANSGNNAFDHSAEQTGGNFSGYSVDKYEPVSHDRSCLINTTNTRQIEQYGSLHDRASKALKHKFDGSEQTFKRKLAIKGALPRAGTYALGCSAIAGGIFATASTAGIAGPAVVAGEIAVLSAIFGYTGVMHGKHKYFIHEKKWFQHLVDKEHMELLLKEAPEEDDIKALEAFVVKVNEQLSAEQFDSTYKSLKKAIPGKNRKILKDELKTIGPHVFNMYLELAKQRHTQNPCTNTSYDTSIGTTDESAYLSEEMEKLQKALTDTRKIGIDNPAFTDD
ncbi:hypothetical protein [Endozoicomonas sp. SCSIO W0465]|uniref:hypothetical protein n=1 Tax=Endozoicomonas sp. SCSIO W0465 TaxID=2918516 RepID=UPI00207502EA|nr:hypothetical protein [Endozoicomonas sp. SCSIO W0465]USE36743.1 hypothetical protein MJO57_00390 [Endozoicomonas sp. SCSIO W0465]